MEFTVWEVELGETDSGRRESTKTSVRREHERPFSHFQPYASDLLSAYHAGHRSLAGYSPQGQKNWIQLSG